MRMKKRQLPANQITVHVYGSRYDADKKAANTAYNNLFNGKEIQFSREGAYPHSYGIPITGDGDEINSYVWKFICMADVLRTYNNKNYRFVVHHFDGFSIEEAVPLFYEAFNIPNIALPREYHAYLEGITGKKGLPTLQDINIHDSLDERSAVRHFLGKTVEDIYRSLEEDIDCCCSFMESFYYLGPNAFAYYVKAWEQFYRDFRAGLFDHKDYGESMVAESTLHFLSQRTLLSAQEETPQGRESILNLLTYCEQYYSNAEFEEDDALPKCRAIRATHQALNK